MNYTVYVRTRSWKNDYRWIGTPPPTQWWKANPGGALIANTTGLLRTRSASGARTIITGIKGERQDFAGTTISYDLVIEPVPDGVLSADDVRALTYQFWTNSNLGTNFDQALGASGNDEIDANSATVIAAITNAIENLPRVARPQSNAAARWIGADNPAALNALLGNDAVLYSKLLNADVRAELLARGVTEQLIVAGESAIASTFDPEIAGSNGLEKHNRPTTPAKTPSVSSGGCFLYLVTAVAAQVAIRSLISRLP